MWLWLGEQAIVIKVLCPSGMGSISAISSCSCGKRDWNGFGTPKPIHVEREEEEERRKGDKDEEK